MDCSPRSTLAGLPFAALLGGETNAADSRKVIRPDDADATLIEPLCFQMAIDGSRASWKPSKK